jgi:transposase InsO family protein
LHAIAGWRPGLPEPGAGDHAHSLNQLWVADITCIRLRTEFVYLAVVLDAFSRRVIGWALGRTLEAGLRILEKMHAASEQRLPDQEDNVAVIEKFHPGRFLNAGRLRPSAIIAASNPPQSF